MSETNTVPANRVLLAVLENKPADGVLAVARLMRERAEAATQGTWGLGFGTDIVSGITRTGRASYSCDHHVARVVEDDDRFSGDNVHNEADSEDDAVHIATMANPAVALALADWLEGSANQIRHLGPAAVSQLHDRYGPGAAVAVARAYLTADVEED
jgi:hypothetical protein